ncbi:MAG: TfoX/Sxy family DNA transformation protein [Bacteroidales bacterium]|nr:TfoX/Sxy family DNA transformation protein [Bacteroidales bacterium]
MQELSSLPNVSKLIKRKLNDVNIYNADQLIEIGSREAFTKIKAAFPQSCIYFLFRLEGAVTDKKWYKLGKEKEKELVDYFKKYWD